MIPFEYRRAEDAATAVATVTDNRRASYLAGGTNLVDHMKLGITSPEVLIDISGLELDAVEELPDGGVRLGAGARNSDVAAHPLVRARYPALSQALLAGASGQLRNLATVGGNLLQRTRCVYFQDVTTPCNKRSPGEGCSALGGYTRYHAVLGASEHCIAVHPSDMAVALAALDAVVRIRTVNGERTVPAVELHRLPGEHPERDTVLEHGELITAVDLPPLPFARRSRYTKARDRAAFAFALVSVAAALDVHDGTVHDVRIAFGGLAHKPWRATAAERALRGTEATPEAFHDAAELELADARPLHDNAFKIPLARSMLVSLLRELSQEDT
ncbi:xanthine dehydrogenase family protein subunit M [Saccharomonospora azurea]|uniref:FAD binding domain-containing protein n=1 Tax=Saccharomonospora azurea TaxID=40988 RepID=UPI00023FF082|nr:xanthine dehydrogenase family protein subunit M [Saccharomonospora azurea]EHK87808.1 aerobic-type carbon monoxide dehydrogenase, middle subunit CoxM/CutM-like protein [Saccharomonospora azurea SZMC 14600]